MASTRKAASPAEFIIRSDGFETDFPETIPEGLPETKAMKAFREDRYAALYEMSFKDPEDWFLYPCNISIASDPHSSGISSGMKASSRIARGSSSMIPSTS